MTSQSPLRVVIDTNVVLDWLVFADPSMSTLAAGVSQNRIVVITHAPAIDELQRVLAYRQLGLNQAQQSAVMAAYHAQTVVALDANAVLPSGFPRCRDSDDDHFLALTYQAKADALVSKDNAVLNLRKRAASFGVRILDVRAFSELLKSRQESRTY